MAVYVAGFVVDVAHALDAFPVRVCHRPPAGHDILIILRPFWQLVKEKENFYLRFLQQSYVFRGVMVGAFRTG